MNKKDREKLLKLIAIVTLVTITLLFMFGLKKLPIKLILAVVLVLHYVIVSPSLCKHVYNLYEQKVGFVRWIPVINELEMFSGVTYYSALVASVLTVIVFLIRYVPNSVIGSFLGLKAGMFWRYRVTTILIVVLVITNFIYAFGFCKLLHELNVIIMDRYSTPSGKLDTLICYVLLLVPFVRICPLMVMWTKASNVDRLGKNDAGDVFVEK